MSGILARTSRFAPQVAAAFTTHVTKLASNVGSLRTHIMAAVLREYPDQSTAGRLPQDESPRKSRAVKEEQNKLPGVVEGGSPEFGAAYAQLVAIWSVCSAIKQP